MAVVLLGALAVTGCDGTIRAQPPIYKLSPLEVAVYKTRAEGSARTVTTLPDGVLSTVEVSGVVDFRAARSDTLLEVVKEDGRRVPHQRMVRAEEGVFLGRYLGEDQDAPTWQRVGDTASEPPGFGLIWDGVTMLDAVEEQHSALLPVDERRRRFERSEPPPSDRPAVWVHVVELDAEGRIERIQFELTSTDGRHTLVFSDFGEAPPVEVPEPDA